MTGFSRRKYQKIYIKKLLELINNSIQVTTYKGNIQKSTAFPYTAMNNWEKKLKQYHSHYHTHKKVLKYKSNTIFPRFARKNLHSYVERNQRCK